MYLRIDTHPPPRCTTRQIQQSGSHHAVVPLLTVALLVAAALSIALVLALRHLTRPAADGTFTREALARSPWVANAHRRVTASLTAAGTVLAIALASTILLGDLPLTASVGAGLASAVAIWTYTRPRLDPGPATDPVRHVDLTPRRPFGFGPRWAVGVPFVAASLLIGLLLWTGPLGSPDEAGRAKAFRATGDVSIALSGDRYVPVAGVTTAEPFSGWYYGLPLLVTATLLLAALVYGLAWVARTPRQGGAEGACVDARFRHLSASLMKALAWQLSLMSALDALAFWTASVQVTIGDAAAVWQPTPPLSTAAAALFGVALAALAVALWALLATFLTGRRLRALS